LIYTQYWKLQSSSIHPTILVILVLQNTRYWKLQSSSSSNTGNTSIVKHTIQEAPVFFIQQYWYRKAHNEKKEGRVLTQVPAYTPNTLSRTGTNTKDDLKP
jgi:hypothetical protein